MDDATQPRPTNRRKLLSLTCVLVVAWLVSSTLLTVRSYWRSDSLTLADLTIRAEEGLIWLRVPLVRLARTEEATTEWTSYRHRRGQPVWESEGTEMITLRLQVKNSRLEGSQDDIRFMWGFGYDMDSWLSGSRPGPCIKLIAPIWAVAAVLTVVAGVFSRRRIRFTLWSLLVVISLVGGVLWLLTLRAPK